MSNMVYFFSGNSRYWHYFVTLVTWHLSQQIWMCLNLDYTKTVQFIGIWKAAGGKDTHKQSVVKLWSKGELVGGISFGNQFFSHENGFQASKRPAKDLLHKWECKLWWYTSRCYPRMRQWKQKSHQLHIHMQCILKICSNILTHTHGSLLINIKLNIQ